MRGRAFVCFSLMGFSGCKQEPFRASLQAEIRENIWMLYKLNTSDTQWGSLLLMILIFIYIFVNIFIIIVLISGDGGGGKMVQ